MTRTRVGVLRGGTSSEYELSLKTGAAMMDALPQEQYDVRDIFIDKSGMWHLRGMPTMPARALAQLDVALNALHGGVGEDGTVQRILHRAGVPYAGSTAVGSALSLHKVRAREVLRQAGVRMPRALSFSLTSGLDTAQMAHQVLAQFPGPYVVKPPAEGSSYGISLAANLHELPDAIADVLDRYGAALVEEFIAGRHAVVGIIERFRNEALYALPPARLVLPEGSRILLPEHFDSEAVHHFVPSDFTDEQKWVLMNTARQAHQALGLEHFSVADLIVAPRRVYLLEVNAVPALYRGSPLPSMLESVGSSVRQFLEHAIHLARA